VAILLVDIGGINWFSISGYWCISIGIILMDIDGY
jgi:hypothetical protein